MTAAWRLLLPILAVFACQTIFSAPRLDPKIEKFGAQLAYFYKNPSAKAFEKFQKELPEFQDKLLKNPGTKILVAVFLSKVNEKYGFPILESKFSEMAREIRDPDSKIGNFVRDDSKVNPTKLDIWWTSFSATGDTKYLDKIFAFVGEHSKAGKNIGKMMIIGAASWSFKANCHQHSKVMEYAKAKLQAGGLSPEKKKFLEQCVKQKVEETPPESE